MPCFVETRRATSLRIDVCFQSVSQNPPYIYGYYRICKKNVTLRKVIDF